MKNIITFYSADNKVGTTMLCQSTAELIAKNKPQKKILIAHFDGNTGTEYTEKHQYCLDDIRLQLISDVLSLEDFLSICSCNGNLYSLEGCKNILIRKFYEPNQVKKLFDLLKDFFDLIIVDAGCSDRGLTMGALMYSDVNILVTTQQKSAHTKYMKMKELVFGELSINFELLVVNQFTYSSGSFLPTEKEIASLYKMEDDECIKIERSNYAWQAEYEKLPLTEYKEKAVMQGLNELVSYIEKATEFVNGTPISPKAKKKGLFQRKERKNAFA